MLVWWKEYKAWESEKPKGKGIKARERKTIDTNKRKQDYTQFIRLIAGANNRNALVSQRIGKKQILKIDKRYC